jgi:hypothetical protein
MDRLPIDREVQHLTLSEQTRSRIDREVAKYPADQKQSAVIASLTIVQRGRAGSRRPPSAPWPTISACRRSPCTRS